MSSINGLKMPSTTALPRSLDVRTETLPWISFLPFHFPSIPFQTLGIVVFQLSHWKVDIPAFILLSSESKFHSSVKEFHGLFVRFRLSQMVVLVFANKYPDLLLEPLVQLQ